MFPLSALADLNEVILRQIRTMPEGGGYATNREASQRLAAAIHAEGPRLRVTPQGATPSYCSGASYLVFLKTVEALERHGQLRLTPEATAALAVRGQPDGTGIWGRWNANGPGTARLFYELGLGRNFTSYAEARPGDFMKIFWTKEVGKAERGHSVIFLGLETVNGVEHVRFWSSNQPGGYGEKSVPRSKIAHALFSRLEHPERLNAAPALPKSDPYLAGLLSKASSFAEACKKSGL